MKRLVLAGGGHAHLHVLQALAQRPLPGWEVVLLSPHPHQVYSGMLPGWIAGHHALQAAQVPLAPLAHRAGATFHCTAVTALDAGARTAHCTGGLSLPFDLLSLDTGPAAAAGIPVDSDDVLPIRPLTGLVAAWPALAERIAARRDAFHLAIVGAGAGGLELAFAVDHRARREGWSHLSVTLAGSQELPLAGAPQGARRAALALMQERGIRWVGGAPAQRIANHRIVFEARDPMAFDACWLATGAAAPPWLQGSGLALDAQGFVQVATTLQSTSHAQVFAAGDVASLADPPGALPKSGVYAVRAGPPLARNLCASALGQPLQAWTPQRRALYLVSTGGKHALGMWGGWSWNGRWAWRWKDRIDRRFVAQYMPSGGAAPQPG